MLCFLPSTSGSVRFFLLDLAFIPFTTLPLRCLLYQLTGFSLACTVSSYCSLRNLWPFLTFHVVSLLLWFYFLVHAQYLSFHDIVLLFIPCPLPFFPCSNFCSSSVPGNLQVLPVPKLEINCLRRCPIQEWTHTSHGLFLTCKKKHWSVL